MSWYVRELLINSEQIRSAVIKMAEYQESLDYDDSFPSYHYYDYDENTYLDLLTVEQKYKELLEDNFITCEENKIVLSMLTNKRISQIERDNKISHQTLIKKFNEVCNRVAFHLGENFTDEGYISYLTEKYNFNIEEVKKLREYINEEK